MPRVTVTRITERCPLAPFGASRTSCIKLGNRHGQTVVFAQGRWFGAIIASALQPTYLHLPATLCVMYVSGQETLVTDRLSRLPDLVIPNS